MRPPPTRSRRGDEAEAAKTQGPSLTNAAVRLVTSPSAGSRRGHEAEAAKTQGPSLTNAAVRLVTSAATSPDLRGFEWRALWERSRGQEAFAFTNLARPAVCLVFAPDGRTLVSGGDDGVHLWDVAERRPLGLFPGPDPGPTNSEKAPTDEELRPMLEASPAVAEHLKVQPGIRDYLDARGHTGRTRMVNSLAFTPDGKHLLVGSRDFVRSWSFATGAFDFAVPEDNSRASTPRTSDLFVVANDQLVGPDDEMRTAHPQSALVYSHSQRRLVAELPGYGFRVAISPDGGYVAATSRTNGVVLWQPATGKTVPFSQARGVAHALSFSPDGRTLFFASNARRTFLWDVPSKRIRAELSGAHRLAAAVDWSPDGRTLATGGDQSVALWSVPPAGATNGPDDGPSLLLPHTVLQGHEAAVTALAFSPDGRRLASSATDHSIRLWAISDASPPVAAAPTPPFFVDQLGESPLDATTGCLIGREGEDVSGRPTGKLALLDARPGSVPQPLPGTEHQLYAGYLAQGQGFVTVELGTNDVPVQFELRRLPDGAVRTSRQFLSVPDGVRHANDGFLCVSASPDGCWLTLPQTDAGLVRNLEVYDLRTGQFTARLPGVPQALITRLRVSPDSRWLVRLDHINGDNWITTYDSRTWGPPRVIHFRSTGKDVLLASIDAASRRIATGGPDGNSLRIWDLLTGRLEAQCASGGLACHPVWSPDGRTLVFNYGSGVHFWSTIVFRELTAFPSDYGRVGAPLGYTPDGHTMVGFTWDGEVKTWSPRTLAEIDRLP